MTVVLGSAFFCCLSIVIAGLVLSRDRLMGIGQAITMPLFFASNALYPEALMPGWVQAISYVNPLSYEVEALRGLLIGVPARLPLDTHGRAEEAENTIAYIEDEVEHGGRLLPPVDASKAIVLLPTAGIGYGALLRDHPKRAGYGAALMIRQSFLYNANLFHLHAGPGQDVAAGRGRRGPCGGHTWHRAAVQ